MTTPTTGSAIARSIAFIPEDEVTRLLRLRDARDLPGLRTRVAQLRRVGWTLAGIGAPIDVPYSTVRAWSTAAETPLPDLPDDLPTPGRPPRRTGHVIRVRKMRPDVPPNMRPRLRALTDEARVIRRTTAPNHPYWRAQVELETLLDLYITRGVPIASLARYCGVSNRAISARMERRDERLANPASPSTTPTTPPATPTFEDADA